MLQIYCDEPYFCSLQVRLQTLVEDISEFERFERFLDDARYTFGYRFLDDVGTDMPVNEPAEDFRVELLAGGDYEHWRGQAVW